MMTKMYHKKKMRMTGDWKTCEPERGDNVEEHSMKGLFRSLCQKKDSAERRRSRRRRKRSRRRSRRRRRKRRRRRSRRRRTSRRSEG